jgi:hypothetical protein
MQWRGVVSESLGLFFYACAFGLYISNILCKGEGSKYPDFQAHTRWTAGPPTQKSNNMVEVEYAGRRVHRLHFVSIKISHQNYLYFLPSCPYSWWYHPWILLGAESKHGITLLRANLTHTRLLLHCY